MKIELINNNQIKCFLSKNDLVSREIKVNELAYGSSKAQELFRDMMNKANDEYGFEADNVPLMIEAIPLPSDSIMLIITKVENPDEFEDKFAKLPSNESKKFTKKALETNIGKDKLLTSPDETESEEANTPNHIKAFMVYCFKSFSDVEDIAPKLMAFPIHNSTLYLDRKNNDYYLILISNEIKRESIKVIRGLLGEYAEQIMRKKTVMNHYDEHYETIIKDNALKVLISI